ncbi:MAG: dCTP deaminase [Candidatus Thermoplasmatota archaeon]|nr:dCTP deaminase [Candidatus Thermoplasmatota archaeon]MBS3801741.1 dCTP deaminase [Candidatus Thermoplasmatota archaeon]
MSVLSDADINEYMNESKLGLEPFNPKNLTPNGYDLSIEEVYIKKTESHINEGLAVVPPLSWFAISTKEFVKMSSRITAQLWIRSSYARKGVMASFGKVDAGFHGTLTISCFNANDEELEIPVGDRFCQIVFEKLESIPSELYDKKSGTYQNQRGVTLKK